MLENLQKAPGHALPVSSCESFVGLTNQLAAALVRALGRCTQALAGEGGPNLKLKGQGAEHLPLQGPRLLALAL